MQKQDGFHVTFTFNPDHGHTVAAGCMRNGGEVKVRPLLDFLCRLCTLFSEKVLETRKGSTSSTKGSLAEVLNG
jgi:hypothetical protein